LEHSGRGVYEHQDEEGGLEVKKGVLWIIVGLLLVLAFGGVAEASDEAISAWVDQNKDAILKDWLDLVVIPGKSRQEGQRLEWLKKKFTEIGLADYTVDEVGNIYATVKGDPGRETVLVEAHMDTVFDNDTPLKADVRDDGWLYCPGSGDDTPGVIGVIWLRKGMEALGIRSPYNITFLITVQEEVGLKGMKYYLENAKQKPDMVVSVDGGIGSIAVGARGIDWYKVYAKGPGGHTNRSLGLPSAVKSLALAITEAYKFQVEQDPAIYFNMGVIGGGTTENAVAEEAWVTLDMRSQSAEALKKLEDNVFPAMEKAITDSGCTFVKELIMDISAGQVPGVEKHRLVLATQDAWSALGYRDIKLNYSASINGNVSMAMGIPTIGIGMSTSENAHSLNERSRVDSINIGEKHLLMLFERLK
jgi:acetylornithine deacetylase/succinyl-diaminopimelate desuccinylase-like protein